MRYHDTSTSSQGRSLSVVRGSSSFEGRSFSPYVSSSLPCHEVTEEETCPCKTSYDTTRIIVVDINIYRCKDEGKHYTLTRRLQQRPPMLRREKYELSSFYPKVRGYITSAFEDSYLRIITTEEEYKEDESIDKYGSNRGGELRLEVATRSRGNKQVAYDGKVAEVTYFHISRARNLLTSVVGDVQGRKILDMSAGWGDRLVASLQLGAVYTGFDPSSNMRSVYDDILTSFPSEGSSVTTLPFEDATLTEKYDIALTSPPYYDVEIYNDEDTQSIRRYPTYERWMREFLLPSLTKMIDVLNDNGYLILHLGDTKSVHLAEAALLYIFMYHPSMMYIGVVGIGNEKVARPVWVFQRQEERDSIPYFRTYYPVLDGQDLVRREGKPIQVRKVKRGKEEYTIYSDDELIGGTKSRALHYLVQHNSNVDRFIYAGPLIGLACVALAKECHERGKGCVLYLQGKHGEHRDLLVKYGADIREGGTLKDLEERAVVETTSRDYLVPFGLDDVIFIEHLTEELRITLRGKKEPKRCWLACGSGVLLRCLAAVWKTTFFCVVTVGKVFYADTYSEDIIRRVQIYHYPTLEKVSFLQPVRTDVPKWMIKEYDAKAYHLMTLNYRSGDVMWNVGK